MIPAKKKKSPDVLLSRWAALTETENLWANQSLSRRYTSNPPWRWWENRTIASASAPVHKPYWTEASQCIRARCQLQQNTILWPNPVLLFAYSYPPRTFVYLANSTNFYNAKRNHLWDERIQFKHLIRFFFVASKIFTIKIWTTIICVCSRCWRLHLNGTSVNTR